jgi:hypothetical protein
VTTTGSDPHPEVAEISDCSEGLLPPERSAAVREHLDGCILCTDVLASLEEIRGLLGTLPGPQRMPADIAGRIDAALAAEALLDATRPAVPRETSAGSAADAESHAAVRPEVASAAAPAPGSRAGAHPVPRETSSAPRGRADASTGPGRPGLFGRSRASGGGPAVARRRHRGLVAVCTAAVLALGGVIYGAVTAGGGATSAGSDTVSSAKRNDSAAVEGSLANRVHEMLAQSAPATGARGEQPRTTDRGNTPMLRPDTDPTKEAPNQATVVPSCVLLATHRSQAPLAAGRELYHGTETYLLVLPHPGDGSRVDAFVVNASCTASSPGAVLFQSTYPR